MGSLGLSQDLSKVQFSSTTSRADEIDNLLKAVQEQLIQFIRFADEELNFHQERDGQKVKKSSLVDAQTPSSLSSILAPILDLPATPQGGNGILSILESTLAYSVNTSAPGFLDKLYAAPTPPGIAADVILSFLNTNLHVYQVSPVLTLIEKATTKALAVLFGLTGPRAGGINVQGGSASNTTSIVLARNTLYPETKIHGNNHGKKHFVLFTSAHGHYSIEKAAQMCGFGSAAVISVPVDSATGAMIPEELERLVILAKKSGQTPLYVNATAGTTVLGSFDPFRSVAAIAKRHSMWFHIDGAWGGSFIFSEKLKCKLEGSKLADSIAINPHKMMGVPVTCSFLLVKDLRELHRANTLPAGYLFHGCDGEDGKDEAVGVEETNGHSASSGIDLADEDEEDWNEPNDLADLTLQCGRRGDSLKLFLSWQYYGKNGYAERVENAHVVATHLATMLSKKPDIILVSQNPPPCLQVCFYFAPEAKFVFGDEPGQIKPRRLPRRVNPKSRSLMMGRHNSLVTERITKALVPLGFMVDFAPPLEGQEAKGKFFRVVVNIQTCKETVERLVSDVQEIGKEVVQGLRSEYGIARLGED